MTPNINLPESTDMQLAETPDEWLLALFDAYRNDWWKRLQTNYVRPLFQLVDDHPGAQCADDTHCRHWSGLASWPEPAPVYDLLEYRGDSSAWSGLNIRADTTSTELVLTG